MKIYKSALFDQFQCIASACPDSCCKEWSVTVDPRSAAMYQQMEGPLGDRLRQVLTEEDGDIIMTIENGRCPMWCQDGLCRIQAELGHDALCKICQEFPRLTHDYGDFVEYGLELSCPEAANMILSCPAAPMVETEVDGGEAPQYDTWDMQVLLRTRQEALTLLTEDQPIQEALALLLLFGYEAQSQLDGGGAVPFDKKAALQDARNFAKKGDTTDFLNFFKELEILDPNWLKRLETPQFGPWDVRHLRLASYFVERYWLQAVSDFDLVARVKFAIISCLAVKFLGGDPLQAAQRYSKEIENDPENVEAILDGAYTYPAFTDDQLLGLLFQEDR